MAISAADLLGHINEFLASEESDLPQYRGVRQQGQHMARMLSSAGAGALDGEEEQSPGQKAAADAAEQLGEPEGDGPKLPDTGDKKPASFQEAREAAQELVKGDPT